MKFILGMIFLFIGVVFLLPGILALVVGLIGGIIGLVLGIFGAVIGVIATVLGAIFGSIFWLMKGLIIAGLIVLGVFLIVRADERNSHVHSGRSQN